MKFAYLVEVTCAVASHVSLSMARDLPVMVDYQISDMGHLR